MVTHDGQFTALPSPKQQPGTVDCGAILARISAADAVGVCWESLQWEQTHMHTFRICMALDLGKFKRFHASNPARSPRIDQKKLNELTGIMEGKPSDYVMADYGPAGLLTVASLRRILDDGKLDTDGINIYSNLLNQHMAAQVIF